MHRQLGWALVPWMLVGGASAIAFNHSRGFAASCDRSPVLAEPQAEPAARRAWGHLMAKASLAGERVELVAGSAHWLARDAAAAPAPPAVEVRPSWATAARLEGFALPELERPSDPEARVAFLVRGDDRWWSCTVELDGDLRVDPAQESDATTGAVLDGRTSRADDGPWAAAMDALAAAVLLWGLSGCIALWRSPSERRSGLVALATGAAALAAFVTAI